MPVHLSAIIHSSPGKADDSGILDRIIRLPKSEMTVYKLLSKITEETGYLFIYDSKLVDNERTVKLKGGKQTVRQAILQYNW